MKTIKKYIVMIAMCVALACSLSSCWNQNYVFFEDDEWSGSDYNEERYNANSELDLDDVDR